MMIPVSQNKHLPPTPINQKIDDRRPRFPLWEEWQDYEEEKSRLQLQPLSSYEYEIFTQQNVESFRL
jgi:hypothetical protein